MSIQDDSFDEFMMEASLQKVNAIFISDLHLGWRYSKPKRTARFLSQYECNYLYIVGDFIDLWKLYKKWCWKQGMWDLFHELLRMNKQGTHIIFVPGNHDDYFKKRQFAIPGLEIIDETVHFTRKGEKILIIHGDKFDTILQFRMSKWTYYLGDKIYDLLIWANGKINFFRKLFHRPYWSISAHMKRSVKNAVTYLNDFENLVGEYALKNECVGVVCGHIHLPCIKTFAKSGVKYYNCGSWIEGEGEAAIIEDLEGNFTLYHKEEED